MVDVDSASDPVSKRRKVRKGTRSCWDCRRRKLKCTFDAQTDSHCVGCQQRGTNCVSQDLLEDTPATSRKGNRIGNRVVRVEALVEQLIRKIDSDAPTEQASAKEQDAAEINGIPTPTSTYSDDYLPRKTTGLTSAPGKYHDISKQLHEALPSLQDVEILCLSDDPRTAPVFHELLILPYSVLDKDGLATAATFSDMPQAHAHPVLIARYMLRLTAYLQHPHLDLSQREASSSESLKAIVSRIATASAKLVTSNDELVGSIEGLECLMLESHYHLSIGNLRQGWVVIRRAIALAQLMGIDRHNHDKQFTIIDPRTRADPQFMWFRMNSNDRHLCLMLGLPQASHDCTMADDAALAKDTLDGRMERLQTAFQSRLLERYDSGGKFANSLPLRELDHELQRMARIMPSTWWLLPNFARVKDDPKALFWELRRLVQQLNHYYLLLQLHNPYFLRSPPCGGCEYSRTTCVTAAREVMTRFILFRCAHPSGFSCATVNFFALTATLTLVLAYLDAHRNSSPDSLLGHQYLTDRGMMEETQKNMEEASREGGNSLSCQSADLVRRLLAIEAQAASGHTDSVERVSVQAPDNERALTSDEATVVRVQIPYFGVINIAREGVISKEPPVPQHTALEQAISGSSLRQHVVGKSSAQLRQHSNPEMSQENVNGQQSFTTLPDTPELQDLVDGPASTASAQFADINPDVVLSQQDYPSLVAGMEDWAFQGVDMAFFDSLMSGINDVGEAGGVY